MSADLLAGIRVVDFSQFLAGPSAALRLADFGADVVKIENPKGGDLSRSLYVSDLSIDGDSTIFHAINRNKKSFAADLKNADDRETVKKLIARADVVIQNFRPGVMERLGFAYEQVVEYNPSVVYASVSGYGPKGPWKDRPGQDLLIQALSGFAWMNGRASSPPVPAGVAVADMFAGAQLVQGVLAALLRRANTGRGGLVEVSLLEAIMDLQFEFFSTYLNGDGKAPVRAESAGASAFLGAPYGIYPVRDGYVAIAMSPIERLVKALDAEELHAQLENGGAFSNRDTINDIVGARVAELDAATCLERLDAQGVWCAQVRDWPQLMEEEGFRALEMVQEVTSQNGHLVRTTRCPIRVDGAMIRSGRGAPSIGSHNDAILAQLDQEQASA